MNQVLPTGYDPKCSIYPRQLASGTKYYLSYYLPGEPAIRMCRPCAEKKADAKRIMVIKEKQLLNGLFDEKDRKKLNLPEIISPQGNRLSLDQAIKLYCELTGPSKQVKVAYNDRVSLNKDFLFFKDLGRAYIDEVTALDVQLYLNHLSAKGLAEATCRHAMINIRKLYNWLILEAEIFEGKNPVSRRIKIPKKGGLVRDRLLSESEAKALLSVKKEDLKSNVNTAPIWDIVRLALFTGARLGELLHLEWGDLDLEKGIWTLKYKPNCPSSTGLGWQPKWNKSRRIILLPVATQLLQELPRLKTYGYFKEVQPDGSVKQVRKPGNFVFAKRLNTCPATGKSGEFYARVDRVDKSWATYRALAGVENLQIKDLRTYFNHHLRKLGFSSKEAGAYLGNSEEVNEMHYSPVSEVELRRKLALMSEEEVFELP